MSGLSVTLTVFSIQALFAGIFCELMHLSASESGSEKKRRPVLYWILFAALLAVSNLLPLQTACLFLLFGMFPVSLFMMRRFYAQSWKKTLLYSLGFEALSLLSAILCIGTDPFQSMLLNREPEFLTLPVLYSQGMFLFFLVGIAALIFLKNRKRSEYCSLLSILFAGGSLTCFVLSICTRLMNQNSLGIRGTDITVFLMIYLVAFVLMTMTLLIQKRNGEKALLGARECIEAQKNYYSSLEKAGNNFEKIRSDYEETVTCLLNELNQDSVHSAKAMTDSLCSRICHPVPEYTSSPAVNAILHEKKQHCLSEKIRFEIDLKLDSVLEISSLDLCIALGNILDNALKACRKLDDSLDRYIEIRGRIIQNHLILDCSNSCPENRKRIIYGTGFGQQILQDLASSYDGTFRTRQDRAEEGFDIYRTTLIMQNFSLQK